MSTTIGVPTAIVFGDGGIITIMSGPGGVVRLHVKTASRGVWSEVVLSREKAQKLARKILEATLSPT